MIRFLLIAACASLCWPASASDVVNASVYLIAAEPKVVSEAQHYSEYDAQKAFRPALLYRLEGDVLRRVRTISTRRQSTITVQIFHEHGFGVVVSRGADYRSFLIDVLDFSDMSRERSLDMRPECNDGFCSLLSSGLLRLGDRLIYAIKADIHPKTYEHVYAGVYFDTWEPAEGIDRWNFRTDAYRYGQTGYRVPGIDSFLNELDGALGYLYERGTKVFPVGWSLPSNTPRDSWFLPNAPNDSWTLVGWNIETDFARVIRGRNWSPGSPSDKSARDRTWLALDKHANQWSTVTIFGRIFALQAFWDWIVFTDRHYGLPDSLDLERLETHRSEGFLSAAERFRMYRRPPTGRFHFYNVRSGTLHAYDTGESNSEALYVDERDRAYLRVSDELWRIPLAGDSLGPVTVLAKQPELWAVHWLVMGSP